MTINLSELVDNNFKAHRGKAVEATKKPYLRSWFVDQAVDGGGRDAVAAKPEVEKLVAARFVELEKLVAKLQELVDNNFKAHPGESAEAIGKTWLRSWFVKQALNGGGPMAANAKPEVEQLVCDRFLALQAVTAVIEEHPDKFEQARAKPANQGWFKGQALKRNSSIASHDLEKAIEFAFAAAA